jgi:hypothetical protein
MDFGAKVSKRFKATTNYYIYPFVGFDLRP